MALDATSAPAVSVPDLDVGTAARRSSWSEDGANDDYASSAAARRWRPACPSMCRDNERRMKRELLAWAKAVVNMAISQSMQC
ncbi:hypothetical protein SORBI_3006G101400 [Sorghum bicolor]|uniref:Uncharacterized protein n=1 Tax=Sorghum bicolor TaxID=4558 RepID=A0A1B6PLA3_SORBI|nr:hypothetical protein SORBI_3006G101400 [Sorghum bicolor]